MRWRSLAPHQDPQHKVKRSSSASCHFIFEDFDAQGGMPIATSNIVHAIPSHAKGAKPRSSVAGRHSPLRVLRVFA
ncbi:protein of unknown function [Methanoculleus bourgensis]|uniref:Uncharacterized protein n=1 Tax=Methanoculleus bourgensis TaxID=83986 RepID=A0A0X3BI01_9EURY|nr:protein of unknown function [Methanoculleus bourgensis]